MDNETQAIMAAGYLEMRGLEIAYKNILVGNLEAVLLEIGLDDWQPLLLHAITEIYRIHSWEPEPALAALAAGLVSAIPEVTRLVAERDARYDAADAVLKGLPAEQRRLVGCAYGWC